MKLGAQKRDEPFEAKSNDPILDSSTANFFLEKLERERQRTM